MERIEEENEGDEANKENDEEESVAILEDEDKSDDDIASYDPEINEPDMAEDKDEVDSANNEVVQTSSKRKGCAANQNISNELNKLTKALDFVIKKITSSSA
ncbi:hypothetical protein VP01_6200g1 [Puccinia sorghi]|uniref:Uncharacterized protein n=1 Tax=Puccinia sorghi TaxID=27349 RepID=A0A0L6UHH0_9BASI|nr:hypothetical protein VP01_6200g1 [Puccinia sorghi]